MTASEPVRLTRVQLVRPLREGRQAARDGLAATTCPYSPTGSAADRVRVAAWLHAYVRESRFIAQRQQVTDSPWP
jgi:hypothetical protein